VERYASCNAAVVHQRLQRAA